MAWDSDLGRDMKRLKRQMKRFFRDWGFDRDVIDLRDEVDESFDRSEFKGSRKARMDFREENGKYVLEVELPGVDKEDISLNVSDGRVEIRAGKKKEDRDEGEGSYSYSQSFVGFHRIVELPENADCDSVDANYKNGILLIKISKKEKDFDKREVEIK